MNKINKGFEKLLTNQNHFSLETHSVIIIPHAVQQFCKWPGSKYEMTCAKASRQRHTLIQLNRGQTWKKKAWQHHLLPGEQQRKFYMEKVSLAVLVKRQYFSLYLILLISLTKLGLQNYNAYSSRNSQKLQVTLDIKFYMNT